MGSARSKIVAGFFLHVAHSRGLLLLVSKPKITPAGTNRFNVAHRGITGQVWKDEGSRGHQSWRGVINGRLNQLRRPCSDWTGEGAFASLIELMDEQAECQQAIVAADAFQAQGGSDRLMLLGGQPAWDAFQAALVQLHAYDCDGLGTVLGMMKAASKRKPIKAVSVQAENYAGVPYALTVVPGFSVAFANGPTYFIGDRAEHGSYNLHYFGEITSITAKTVAVTERGSGTRRLKIGQFAWRNDKTPASKAQANSDTMLHI